MILIFETKEGTSRVLHSLGACKRFKGWDGPMFGWWRSGNKLGFCLSEEFILSRFRRIACIDEESARGFQPVMILDEGEWRL